MFGKLFGSDQREDSPVKIDLPQARLLGSQSYRSFFRLVANNFAVSGIDLACSRIHGDDLKEIAGFDYASPVEGRNRIGKRGYADGFFIAIGDGIQCVDGATMLVVADENDGDEAEQGEDGSAASAEARLAGADFVTHQTDERGHGQA